jgi:myo-inositol catabolism protein IolC
VNGIVYLIESLRDYDTVYKIGYTRRSSKKRSKQLQTGTDGQLKVIYEHHTEHGQTCERAIQRFYSHLNIQNEWFKLSLEDVNNFKNICDKVESNLSLINNFYI